MNETEQEQPEQPQEAPEAPEAPTDPEAEPETPEQPTEPEQPAEPPAEGIQTPEEIEAIAKKLEGLQKHVSKRLGDILGDDAPLYQPCPVCTSFQTPGFVPPIPPPIDVQTEIYHYLGQAAPSDYQEDSHSAVCSKCGGWGEVATGSKVQGQDRLPCIECGGMGWVATDDARRARSGLAPNGLSPSFPPPALEASAMPEQPAEDDPRVAELRREGYAVIPPYKAPA